MYVGQGEDEGSGVETHEGNGQAVILVVWVGLVDEDSQRPEVG